MPAASPPLSRTPGARLVRALRMRVPTDPLHRVVQEAQAVMGVGGAAYLVLQSGVVIAGDGLEAPTTRIRVAANLVMSIATLVTLLTVTRQGNVLLTARVVGGVLLAYQALFAWAFGFMALPSVVIVSLPVLAGLSIIEARGRVTLWGLAFALLAAVGLATTPRFPLGQTQGAVAVSVFAAFVILTLFLLEYREVIVRQVAEARDAADEVSVVNAELRAALAERDRLAAQLVTAQRLEAMGRVAGGIAHDFNNLLTVIRGYADLVLGALPPDPHVAEDAQQLRRSLTRASRVTQDVLDFARPRPVGRSALDLGTFVREVAAGLDQTIGAGHPLRLTTTGGPLVVEAERARVERLLVNLVLNARDASPPGAAIDVAVARDGDRVRLVVSDRGPGVRPEDRDRIFEPFFTTKGTTGGTGLGLATSFALMHQHGGTLRVEDAPEGGAAFVADFPAAPERAPTRASIGDDGAVASAGRPLAGLRALVVEDDAGVRALTLRFLQQAGAVVVAAEDGEQGLDALHRSVADAEPFHVVVSDLRLPRGTGAAVLRAAQVAWPEASLVAMSGFLEDDDVARMAAAQVLVFLPKPFTAVQFGHAVAEARAPRG